MGRRATASTAASEPLRENLAVCCSSTVGGVPRATPRSSSTRSSAILVIQPSNMMQAMQRFGAAFPRSRAALLRAIACSRTSTTTSRSTCAARALLGKPLPPQQFFQRIARRCSPPQRRGCSNLLSARWHISLVREVASKREVTLIASFKIARSSPPNCTRLAQRRSNHLVRSSHLVHHRVHGLRHRYTAYD